MDNLLVTLLRILVIGIRLLLLFFSIVGWIVFTVGFVHLDKKVHKYYDPNTFIYGPEFSKICLGLANVLFVPMWLFMASGLAVYITLALHIIISHQNIRHILHSILMFFNVFYMFGGSGSLIVALLYHTPKTADTLQKIVYLDQPSIKIVLYGVSLSVGMYWISTWLWPLFELRRRRRTAYAYQPIPQDDDVGSHVQGGYGYGSGRFSHSVTKELCQQVSQEYGEYD